MIFSSDAVRWRSHEIALILAYDISVDNCRFSTVVVPGNKTTQIARKRR
jgi:hypothetical protein